MSVFSKTHILPTCRERFITDIYARADEAVACTLERLRTESGIRPTCALGCDHCCRQHILTNPVEVHALGQFVRRQWPAERVAALQLRTRRWHAWENAARLGAGPSSAAAALDGGSGYDHCCPLLVDGACSAYPVRPLTCRTHFVHTPAEACRASNDPHSGTAPPAVIAALVNAARPFAAAVKDYIEQDGVDFSRSILLLPHGLAIEMDWDFAIRS